MTYRRNYQDWLENCIAKGGTPKQMEKTVIEFNSVENLFYRPTEMFKKWALDNLQHLCTSCGQIFSLRETPVDLDEETTCHVCKAHGTCVP